MAATDGKRGWYWPALLIALLLLPVGANGYLMLRATNDPSFFIEKDYYKKAVAWDQHQAEARRSAELGWHVELKPDPAAGGQGAAFTARLLDRSGQPVAGARLQLSAVRIARSSETFDAAPKETAPGNFVFSLPLRAAGLYEWRVSAQRGSEVYSATLRKDVTLPPGGPS